MWCAEAEREVCCGVEGRAGERCGVVYRGGLGRGVVCRRED